MEGFPKRNGTLVENPEAAIINIITTFNEAEVQFFYKNLEKPMKTYKFNPKILKIIIRQDPSGSGRDYAYDAAVSL